LNLPRPSPSSARNSSATATAGPPGGPIISPTRWRPPA